jgi:hypothetical protein
LVLDVGGDDRRHVALEDGSIFDPSDDFRLVCGVPPNQTGVRSQTLWWSRDEFHGGCLWIRQGQEAFEFQEIIESGVMLDSA